MTTWTITALDCSTTDVNPDTVITAHWTCSSVDGEYSASVFNTCSFTQPDPANFIPYNQLTQDEVLGWIWESGVDKTATEEAVAQMIANQKNPPVIQPPLPWAV